MEEWLEEDGSYMRILILGGDGFCGWPTALFLSTKGHEVAILDNLSRRAWDEELGVNSITPIAPIDPDCDLEKALWSRNSPLFG